MIVHAERGSTEERIGFYRVSLDCEAAPAIGCGCRAKPVLASLDQEASIREAHLSRTGTVLAVVWRDPKSARDKTNRVESILSEAGVSAQEVLEVAQREALLTEFCSRTNWYGVDVVDRLSEEEANVIADRFVRRTAAKVELRSLTAEALKHAIADACARVLTINPPNSPEARARRIAEAAVDAVRGDLNAQEMHAL